MLLEEIKNLAGQVISTSVFEVDKESIRRFAAAAGDMNPLYHDAEYAAQSRYGSIIAPPGYISSIWFWEDPSKHEATASAMPFRGLLGLMVALGEAGYRSAIDSGIDYEFFMPVKAGDSITSSSVIRDIKERKSDEGNIVFLITDTTYTNQNNNTVAKVRMTTIHR